MISAAQKNVNVLKITFESTIVDLLLNYKSPFAVSPFLFAIVGRRVEWNYSYYSKKEAFIFMGNFNNLILQLRSTFMIRSHHDLLFIMQKNDITVEHLQVGRFIFSYSLTYTLIGLGQVCCLFLYIRRRKNALHIQKNICSRYAISFHFHMWVCDVWKQHCYYCFIQVRSTTTTKLRHISV